MTPAEYPANEDERMAALYELEILDTEREEVFDRITRLASHIIDAPIFFISFLDGQRNWFKSARGIELGESPRDISFCGHAIHSDDVMLVPDATEDPRFADNPLVTGELAVRFYAGAPLILSSGVRLGTLCAFDTKPKAIDSDQVDALRDLAAVVVDELGLRRGLRTQAEITLDLRDKATELEHANQALEQYVHIASHDLRSPVKNLVNLADLAVLDTKGSLRELVEPMRQSAVEMEELILGYGRLAGLTKGRTATVAVTALIEHAEHTSGHVVEVNVVGDAQLHCDEVLVGQALVNLFQNVYKYGLDNAVTVGVEENEEVVSMIVSNRVRESFTVDHSVFAPFKRLVRGGEGSGLGLSIVERVVQLHNGSAAASCVDNVFTVEMMLPSGSE